MPLGLRETALLQIVVAAFQCRTQPQVFARRDSTATPYDYLSADRVLVVGAEVQGRNIADGDALPGDLATFLPLPPDRSGSFQP